MEPAQNQFNTDTEEKILELKQKIESFRGLKAPSEENPYFLVIIQNGYYLFYQQRGTQAGFFLGCPDNMAGVEFFSEKNADISIAGNPSLNIKKLHWNDFIAKSIDGMNDQVKGLEEFIKELGGREL
jgi:hypothetical protein